MEDENANRLLCAPGGQDNGRISKLDNRPAFQSKHRTIPGESMSVRTKKNSAAMDWSLKCGHCLALKCGRCLVLRRAIGPTRFFQNLWIGVFNFHRGLAIPNKARDDSKTNSNHHTTNNTPPSRPCDVSWRVTTARPTPTHAHNWPPHASISVC